MQIFISINDGDIILTNQILNRADPLTIRLMEYNSISRKNFATQWRTLRGNHRIKSINTKTAMVVNERLQIRSFAVKYTNYDGEAAHLIQRF